MALTRQQLTPGMKVWNWKAKHHGRGTVRSKRGKKDEPAISKGGHSVYVDTKEGAKEWALTSIVPDKPAEEQAEQAGAQVRAVVVTTEALQPFIGGQLEIQNPGEKYLYRGEIATAEVEDGEVRVMWAWVAKAVGFPPVPKSWANHEPRPWNTDITLFAAVKEIGEGRLMINTAFGEIAVFFPRGGSMLDPAKVEGLQLPA